MGFHGVQEGMDCVDLIEDAFVVVVFVGKGPETPHNDDTRVCAPGLLEHGGGKQLKTVE